MDVNNKEMAKQEFEAKQKFYGWEVYSQEQIANYGVHVAALMSKAQSNELTEQEQNTLKIGKAELSNLKPVHVVDHCEGRIVKSTVFIQEPQVHFDDTFEKSESGESIQKGVFLDTPLNKELGRVGQELIKGCVKKVAKSDHKMVYGEFLKKGITGVYDEMKKAFPDMTDEEYEDVKKAFEPDEQPEKKEEDEGDEEEDESEFAKALNIINNNFNKGLISEEVSNKAASQLDNILKARNVKYFKREGSPGNYKYYYTEAQYKEAKGGQQKEIGGEKPKAEAGKPTESGKEPINVLKKRYDSKLEKLENQLKLAKHQVDYSGEEEDDAESLKTAEQRLALLKKEISETKDFISNVNLEMTSNKPMDILKKRYELKLEKLENQLKLAKHQVDYSGEEEDDADSLETAKRRLALVEKEISTNKDFLSNINLETFSSKPKKEKSEDGKISRGNISETKLKETIGDSGKSKEEGGEKEDKGKDKLNPLKRKKFEEAKDVVEGLPYKDKINDLVSEVKEKYKRPIEHNNKVYQGTIFFEDLHGKIGNLGAFTTPKQKEIKTHITTYISSKLTMDDYIVHG